MVEHNIRTLLDLNKVDGDIGIEIEMEGPNPFPTNRDVERYNWRAEEDGSLRGHSKEYVINTPIKIEEVDKHLENLKGVLNKAGASITYSFRAGVHVHLNVQKLTVKQMATLACLYIVLEKPFVKFCGEQREGNHFCLRIQDAEYPVMLLETAILTNNLNMLHTDNIRYSSMNLKAIPTYGSIEFRAMETLPDLGKISDWCKMLIKIKEYAISITERREISYDISFKGPDRWAADLLGEDLFKLISYERIDKDIMHGLRLCQNIIYLEQT
jgi:Putative amidoligase enzyme